MAIHHINLYAVVIIHCFVKTYPLDNIIHNMNNWALIMKTLKTFLNNHNTNDDNNNNHL